MPGFSGTAAEVAACGSGDAAEAFFWSSFRTIFFTSSAFGSAQISKEACVINMMACLAHRGSVLR